MEISDHDILVSYDVSALFTNVPVDETIGILARKAFKDDWFHKEYNLNITEADLIELLEVSTKNQLFQFQGALYEQVDGVAMGSPLLGYGWTPKPIFSKYSYMKSHDWKQVCF